MACVLDFSTTPRSVWRKLHRNFSSGNCFFLDSPGDLGKVKGAFGPASWDLRHVMCSGKPASGILNLNRRQVAKMSAIRDGVKFSSLVACFVLLNSQASAHVVIKNIDSGNTELSTAAAANQVDDERATGELDEYQIQDISDGWNFNARSRQANGPSNRSGDRGRASRQLSFARSNRFAGGGGGGGGGGRSSRVRPRRSEDRREIVQTMVAVNNDSPEPAANTEDAGTDVSIFDSGQGSPSTGGTGGLGGGGSLANKTGEDEEFGDAKGGSYGGRGTVVSGTPEPAAVIIWAVAGTCGFGLLRYQRSRYES